MKLYKYLPLAALVLPLAGCSNVDDDIRYKEVDIESIKSDKVVLIEEFTGQRCVNCPKGAAAVHEMLELLPNNLVAVSMYPSQMPDLTAPISDVDMRTEEASEYFSAYDGTQKGLPAALIDRTSYDGSMLQLTPDSWSSPVFTQYIEDQTPVQIAMNSSFNPTDRKLTVNYNLTFISDVKDEVCFQLWVIENGITAPQLGTGNGGLDPFYTHNHVFRAAINGTWGEEIGDSFKDGNTYSGSGTIELTDKIVLSRNKDKTVNYGNLQVVGFLYRKSDRKVLQAHLLKSI